MRTIFAVRMLALLLVFGLAFGAAQSAWAQSKTQIPSVKTPASERFDITGKVTSSTSPQLVGSNVDVSISGNGAISGDNVEANLTYNLPAGLPLQSGISSTLSLSLVTVDGKIYVKISGLTGAGVEDTWYVFNAPQGTNGGAFSSGGGIVSTNPALAQAYTITEVGKEDLNGAPTTKYRIDIDYNKLVAAIAAQAGKGATPSATPLPGMPKLDVTAQVFLWIGDNDQYIHQMSDTVDMKITGSGTAQNPDVTVATDVTMTFKDFDQPITITAPPNAQPIDLSGLSSSDSSMVQGLTSSFLSNPLSAGVGGAMGVPSTLPAVPAPVTTPPVVVGMPTTGSAVSAAGDLWPLAILGMVCLTTGMLVRRRATTSR